MPYATIDDLLAKYGERFVLQCFDIDAIGSPNELKVTAILEDSSILIDSYLGRYDTPIDADAYPQAARLLRQKCTDIAVYQASADSATLTVEKRVRYEDAIAWLKDLNSGKVDVGIVLPGVVVTPTAADANVVLVDSGPRLFTRNTMGKIW